MDAENFEMGEVRHNFLTPCAHPAPEVRLRTLSNGSTAVHRQCTICGEPIGSAIKKSSLSPEELAVLPAFDNDLRAHYREMETQHHRSRQAQAREEWDAESPARKDAYEEYLKSPEWRAKRLVVLERDKYLCQGCREARAIQVHHLTYAHRGNELLWELIAVCDECHERAHGGPAT